MDARAEFLVSEGLARRQGQRVIFIRDLLETLRRRELDTASAKISAETGLPYHSLAEGESIAGVYRQRVSGIRPLCHDRQRARVQSRPVDTVIGTPDWQANVGSRSLERHD
jgi:hypothetical protein